MATEDLTTWSDSALREAYKYTESATFRAEVEAELARRLTTLTTFAPCGCLLCCIKRRPR
jgi:hypothetical protein